MLKICIPISFESLFNNSRWLILAEVASHLGEAEVAAWAIMCRIWLVSDALAEGIGQAAEIRVAFHLGNNHPNLAKMFAYKSTLLGMFGAFIISGTFYIYLNRIPSLITTDETLQSIMTTTLPYVGFGNMALSFSYLSWYIIGAQGRFKLGMLVSLASLWGITVPLAIVFTWKFQWNLSGLCSAVVIGYTAMGVGLSFFALTSDWEARAQKIYERNAEDKIMEDQDLNYATPKNLRKKSLAVNATNGLRFKVVMLPHEGLMIKLKLADHTLGFEVVEVNENPFLDNNVLFPGDIIVGWNQISLEAMDLSVFEDLLNESSNKDHVVSVISPRFREDNVKVDFEFDHSLNFMAFDI
jgi:MatE